MWIYEHKQWPNFTWDSQVLAFGLADIRHRQGRLLGRMQSLGFDLKREASLTVLTHDVVKSWAIEGEILDRNDVRSSIARRLGIDNAGLTPASRAVEGIVEMMLDATQEFSSSLTKQRLFDWHAALFPTGRSGMRQITVADWRPVESDPMQIISGQVVSGAIGREKIHFEAPMASLLDGEMKRFLKWFASRNNDDPIIRAGIAHFWFVTLHPFEDGNGRIARAIGDMALAHADGTEERFYSLSAQIESERKEYYRQLEKQQRATPDITHWLEWFLACLGRAISSAESTLGRVLFKADLWDRINQNPINARQRLVINRMLDDDFEGFMNTAKYAKMAGCSADTALRDIQGLTRRKILLQNAGRGRSTSYRLVDRRG